MKSRRMKWQGFVECVGEMMHTEIYMGILERKSHLGLLEYKCVNVLINGV
jgi:hypothetical protein